MKQVKFTYVVQLDGSENPYKGVKGAVLMFETYGGKFYLNLGNLYEITYEEAVKLKFK